MSLAPVFPLLAADAAVTAIVVNRIFPGGVVPQGKIVPAVTWLVVAGTPENMLADRTNVDNQRIQIDCWAEDFDVATALGEAVRTALEPHAYLIAMNNPEGASTNTGFDPETKRFRVSTDWSFWVGR